MYLGYNLLIIKDKVQQIIDNLVFNISIRPESIPYTRKFGLEIPEKDSDFEINIRNNIQEMITKLNLSTVSVNEITIEDRVITLNLAIDNQDLLIPFEV